MNSCLLILAILIAGAGWYWTSTFSCYYTYNSETSSCDAYIDEVSDYLSVNPENFCNNTCFYQFGNSSLISVDINCPWPKPTTGYIGYSIVGLWTLLLFVQCSYTKSQLRSKGHVQVVCGLLSLAVAIYTSYNLSSEICNTKIDEFEGVTYLSSGGFEIGIVAMTGIVALILLAIGSRDMRQGKINEDREREERERNFSAGLPKMSMQTLTTPLIAQNGSGQYLIPNQNMYIAQPQSNNQQVLVVAQLQNTNASIVQQPFPIQNIY